ncbi:MAG: ATP-binding protein [Phycisphaera sp.]|nr:ATP-binding protein [Phycisphaera sp.]
MPDEDSGEFVVTKKNVDSTSERLLAVMKELGYSSRDCFAFKLSYTEAVDNGLKHGNRNDPRKRVTVRYAISAKRVQVDVIDEGKGFDPRKVPDPTCDELHGQPNGRGVWLMDQYMDKVTYHPPGNHLTMIKKRSKK